MIEAAQKVYADKDAEIQIAAINSRVYSEVAEAHEITSWPWVTSFYRGQKVEDMRGLGGWESVYRFAIGIYDRVYTKPPPRNVFLEDSPWSSRNQGEDATEEEAAATGQHEE